MKTLKTQVSDAVKKAFVRRAKRKDINESELLRRLVAAELANTKKTGIEVDDDADEQGGESMRVNVRFPKFICAEIDRRKNLAGGMARGTWIRSLVQSNLLRAPVVTDAEILALANSNRQLSAIGRNLNQIARALNLAYHETERIKIEQIESLIVGIEQHKRVVLGLIKAAENRWSADE